MGIFLNKCKRELKWHFTLMLIPHNTFRPIKLSFSLSFLLFLLFSWTGFTIWAGYLASQHIEYWKIKNDNELMKLKVIFFAQQVKKSREMLEQVRGNDCEIRSMLEMKSKKAIIETEEEGKGGPTYEEMNDLTRLLDGKIYDMSNLDIHRQTSALIEETKKQLKSFKEITSFVDDQRSLYQARPNRWPCIGNVTSPFGYRIHPIYGTYEYHSGFDIANHEDTPVYATATGKVLLCDWQGGYGRLIIIDHGYGYRTYYGHLHKILVKQGDRARRGQLIGLMGCTGSSTGTHLHYEVRVNDQPVSPVPFLSIDHNEMASLTKKRG